MEVVLYTEAQVRNGTQQLKSAPAYTEGLKLEQQPEHEKDKKGRKSQPPPPPAELELTEQEVADQSLLDKSVVPSENRKGPDPRTFEDLRKMDTDAMKYMASAIWKTLRELCFVQSSFVN